jgi:hypothetical protein
MLDKITFKKYEILLFFVLLITFLLSIFADHYYALLPYRPVAFFVSASMIIYWALKIRNKDLTNLEVVLCILSIGVFWRIALGIVLLLGFSTDLLFGISVTQLFLIFIVLVILFWFFVLIFRWVRQKEKKISLNKIDILVMACAVVFLFIILLYYFVVV